MTLLLPKSRIIRDRKWLDDLRTHRCILTGQYGTEYMAVEAAHLGALGRGIKCSDDEALPLRHDLHSLGHASGEWSHWRREMPDWLIREALRAYAREYYRKHTRAA